MFDLSHVVETVLSSTIPIGIYMYSNRRQAKHDVEEKHLANQKLLNELLTERKYLPAHGHSERRGPLTAEGIRVGPDAR